MARITPTFKGRVPATLYRVAGFTSSGDSKYKPGMKINVGVVKLTRSQQRTSVRADSAPSKTRATEELYDGRILVEHDVSIGYGDRVTIFGEDFRVKSMFPRPSISSGKIQHIEVDLERWQKV